MTTETVRSMEVPNIGTVVMDPNRRLAFVPDLKIEPSIDMSWVGVPVIPVNDVILARYVSLKKSLEQQGLEVVNYSRR